MKRQENDRLLSGAAPFYGHAALKTFLVASGASPESSRFAFVGIDIVSIPFLYCKMPRPNAKNRVPREEGSW